MKGVVQIEEDVDLLRDLVEAAYMASSAPEQPLPRGALRALASLIGDKVNDIGSDLRQLREAQP